MGKLFERSLSGWRGLSVVQKAVVCAAVVCVTLWGGSKSNGANRAQRMEADEMGTATNAVGGVGQTAATNCFRIVQADVLTNGFRVEAAWTNGHFGAGTMLDWHVATNLSPACWAWQASDDVVDGVTNVARLFAFPDSALSNASFFVMLTARTPATDARDTDGDAIPDVYEWHHGTNPYVPDADLVPRTVSSTETELVAALAASVPYEVIALAPGAYALTQTVHMPAHPVLLMGDADSPAILYSTASPAAFMFSRGQSAQTVVQNLRLVLDVPDGLQVGFWCGGNLPWAGRSASPTFRNVHVCMPHAEGYFYGWLVYRGGAEPLEISSCSVNAAGTRTRVHGICAHNPPPLEIARCSFLNFPTNSGADVAGIVLKMDDLATRCAAATDDLSGTASNAISVTISDSLFDGSFADIHPLARFEDGARFAVTVRNCIVPTGFREGHEPDATNVLHVGDAGVTWCGIPRTNALAVARGVGAFAPFAGDATADSDDDGLTDANEVYALGTDPWFADSDFDSIDDATELALGASPSDHASFPYLLTVKVENAETYADVTNYVAWGVSPTVWETNGLAAFTGDGGALVYSNLVVSGDLYVKCFRDLNTNGVYDADWDILLEQVVPLRPRPSVALAFGDVDCDGVTDLEERLDGTDPYDARNFRLRATLRVIDLDAGNGVTNLLSVTQGGGDWNPAEICAASVEESFDYAIDIVVTGGVKTCVFEVGDCDGDGVPDSDERDEGTDVYGRTNFCFSLSTTITCIFAPGGSNLTAVATFGSSTNAIYGPCVQSNDTLTVDFGHLATTSGARVSFIFWEDLDGDGVHSARERAVTWRPPLTGHAVCVTNELPLGIFDRDSDGILDDWEVQYGLSLTTPSDAARDSDSDGLVDLHEYCAGTDPTDQFDRGDGTLLRAVIDGVDSRLSGVTNATLAHARMKKFLNYRDANNGGCKGVFNANPDFWLSDVDTSCASIWNTMPHTGSFLRGGALISRRHFICALHYPITPGHDVVFMGCDGNAYTNSIVATNAISGTDILIGLLASNMPNQVSVAKILPADYRDYLGDLSYIPIVQFDYDENGLVLEGDPSWNLFADVSETRVYMIEPYSELRKLMNHHIIIGDSGNPSFLLVGDTPILLGCLHVGTHKVLSGDFQGGGCPSLTAHAREVQDHMDALCPGYELEFFDLQPYRKLLRRNRK